MTGSLDTRPKSTPYYRAYFVGEDDRVQRAIELFAESDDEAATQAQQLVNEQDIEVWDRSRFVVRLLPKCA